MYHCCSSVSWMSCALLSCSSSLPFGSLCSFLLLLLQTPLPRPILRIPTPHAWALSDRPPPPVQARCRDWPRASFSTARRTQWPRRHPCPPACLVTPPVSHTNTCTHVDARSSHLYTGSIRHAAWHVQSTHASMCTCLHLTFVRVRVHESVYMCVPLDRTQAQGTGVTCCHCDHHDES